MYRSRRWCDRRRRVTPHWPDPGRPRGAHPRLGLLVLAFALALSRVFAPWRGLPCGRAWRWWRGRPPR